MREVRDRRKSKTRSKQLFVIKRENTERSNATEETSPELAHMPNARRTARSIPKLTNKNNLYKEMDETWSRFAEKATRALRLKREKAALHRLHSLTASSSTQIGLK